MVHSTDLTNRKVAPPPTVASSSRAALGPFPSSAALWASTAERLEVRSTSVLKAPIHRFVCAAWWPHSGWPMRWMMYETRTPPKITISEHSTHHTASRPVGIPVALRVVAIVCALNVRSPLSRRLVLRPVVLGAARDAVLIGTAVDARHLGPVAVRRRRLGRPVQRVGAPRILLGLGTADQAVDEVVEEHELERPHDDQGARGQDAQRLQLGAREVGEVRVVEDAP